MIGWLCWGLTSQSTILQSCRDGAIASWVINQYFRGIKCLAQGHNTAEVGLEPRTSRSEVRHSTTEPPRSPPCHEETSPIMSATSKTLINQLLLGLQTPSEVWNFVYNSCSNYTIEDTEQTAWCTDWSAPWLFAWYGINRVYDKLKPYQGGHPHAETKFPDFSLTKFNFSPTKLLRFYNLFVFSQPINDKFPLLVH